MTKADLHTYFKVAMDKNANGIAFGGCPAFLDEEIDYWLQLAYIQEVNNKFTGDNVLKQPFEKSVKRIHDLEKLVKTETNVTAEKLSSTNTCVFKNFFDGLRMYFIDALLNFNDLKAHITLINHDDAEKYVKTYNNTPWIESPVAVIEDKSLVVYYDPISMNATNYTADITYVKKPLDIKGLADDTNFDEIPEYMQHEVINRAVLLALEDIQSDRVQTKSQLNQVNE